MNEVVEALVAPVGIGLVFLAVVGVDRIRARLRDPRRPVAVVDRRTYRDACRSVDRLVALEDWHRAHAGALAICGWLSSERQVAGAAKRQQLTTDLATWTRWAAEFDPAAAL